MVAAKPLRLNFDISIRWAAGSLAACHWDAFPDFLVRLLRLHPDSQSQPATQPTTNALESPRGL
jgi:hypothetical protein